MYMNLTEPQHILGFTLQLVPEDESIKQICLFLLFDPIDTAILLSNDLNDGKNCVRTLRKNWNGPQNLVAYTGDFLLPRFGKNVG